MIFRIPLTGTVMREGSVWGAGLLAGDPDDPIRPIALDLGGVDWRMVDVDLDNEIMIIDVQPSEKTTEPDLDEGGKQKIDPQTGELCWIIRPRTPAEKTVILQRIQDLLTNSTKEKLYKMSGSPRLRRPFRKKKR